MECTHLPTPKELAEQVAAMRAKQVRKQRSASAIRPADELVRVGRRVNDDVTRNGKVEFRC
jgi:hypothetical protein